RAIRSLGTIFGSSRKPDLPLAQNSEYESDLEILFRLDRNPDRRSRARRRNGGRLRSPTIARASEHFPRSPDGQILAASLTAPVIPAPGGMIVDRSPAVASLPVPGDASHVELWFLNIGYAPFR